VSAGAASAAVTVFVFVDADQSSATGGPAAAPEIDARLVTDPSAGGYELVVGVRGDETVVGVWEWDTAQDQFATVATMPAEVVAEAGVDADPIGIGAANHGYVQAQLDLALTGVSAACDANLFFRSVSDDAAIGEGDLDVGRAGSCVPADDNDNGVPDVVPPPECTNDDQCPAQGICVDGSCRLTAVCIEDTDCDAGEACTADGRCVVVPTGDCTTSAECADGVCQGGQCTACTADDQCAAGQRCAPDGRCIGDTGDDGPTLEPGEEVQGGACACRVSRGPANQLAWLFAGALAIVAVARRRGDR
jgi:hypothetical protein